MNRDAVIDLFRRSGALLEGHFRLSSGLHSPGYLQCALVLQNPRDATRLGEAIARRLEPARPDVVVSPALGGIIIGHEVARALGVRAIFAERPPGKEGQAGTLALRRGFTLSPSDRAAIIEDVVTTGGSTRETITVARAAGAEVIAAGAIADRSGGRARLDVPLHVLLELSLPTYDPAACPLCAEGIPAVKPGSRQDQ